MTIKHRGSWCYEEEEYVVLCTPPTTTTPAADEASPTPSERKQWVRFIKNMLDKLLPYREAYTAVMRLVDETLAASPPPARVLGG